MRILTVTNLYPNPYQPQRAAFNRQQVRALAADHEVRVIAPILWTDEWRERRRQGKRLATDRCWTCDGLDVEHPRYVYPPKLLRNWYGPCFRRSVLKTFARVAGEFQPDVVYAPWAYPDGWALVQLCRARRLPVVVKAHGSDILSLSQYAGRLRKTVDTLREADRIVAVSQDLASRMTALGVDPAKLAVIYNGIDADRFSPGPRDLARRNLGLAHDDPLLLFVGNLVPIKGLDVLLDACARLANQGVSFTCHVLGDGPLRSWLTTRIAQLGLVGKVVPRGQQPHDALPDWYRAANCVVLTSRSEGVPNVLLEAAACGTPFIATSVGGVPEIAGIGPSRIVPPSDPAALSAALADTLREGIATAEPLAPFRRSQQDAANELGQLFHEVCQSRRPPVACGVS